MVKVKPFRALRPVKELAQDVAAPAYDVMNRTQARAYVADKPYSFMNIDRPETQFHEDHDMYAADVYTKANEMIQAWKAQGIFVQDAKASFFLYEQTWKDHVQTGIVALSAIDDYLDGSIRRHENTLPAKEQDRIRHIDTTSCQSGLIFLAYRAQKDLEDIMRAIKESEPEYVFEDDGVTHKAWVVDESLTALIQNAFDNIDGTYIADGHHRMASAVKVGLARRKAHPDYTGEEDFNYVMSILYPDDALTILPYHRLVKAKVPENILNLLGQNFDVRKDKAMPEAKGAIAMRMGEVWYHLKAKDDVLLSRALDPVMSLDTSLLQECVLSPAFGITDPTSDARLSFLGGDIDPDMPLPGDEILFVMHATDIGDLFEVADAGELMPPKSTWFYPKPYSGLFLHEIER